LAEHFKGEWIRIDDISSYRVVEYGRNTDIEELNNLIRDNQEFSTDSIKYEIYVRQG
jgi:hypothetical protein